MNYSNHNLRTDLQEWKNRLYRAPYEQFGHQLKYLIGNLENNTQIYGLVKEAVIKHEYTKEQLVKITEQRRQGAEIEFESEIHQTAFCYQFLKYIIGEVGNYNLHNLILFRRRDFNDTKAKIVEDYISPILYTSTPKISSSALFSLLSLKTVSK